MEFRTPGLRAGALVTLLSVIVLLVLLLLRRRAKIPKATRG
jgi:hypothetical protein